MDTSWFKLLYISRFALQHWFLPRDTIVDTYVVRSDDSGAMTDLLSYYALPSTVMNHPTHKSLRAAYSFYNVSTKTPWNELIGDALVLAKKVGVRYFDSGTIRLHSKRVQEAIL